MAAWRPAMTKKVERTIISTPTTCEPHEYPLASANLYQPLKATHTNKPKDTKSNRTATRNTNPGADGSTTSLNLIRAPRPAITPMTVPNLPKNESTTSSKSSLWFLTRLSTRSFMALNLTPIELTN